MFRRLTVAALAVAGIQGAFALVEPTLAGGGRHAAMILDANTGAVLHADDADELRHPASLTKMMTLYLAFETLESGRLSMSDRVRISQEAANQAPSKLELEPGEDISVSEAIRALITKSANDVAVALAERIGGSEKNFVRLMNVRARELGMSKTHFENASGLPNNEQVTTARDMITLGLRLQDDFPAYYPLFATREFRFNRASYRNHNTLLNSFQGIDGIKTGYTQKSGFNLVSSVRRGGRHVVGAVFGGSSAASRNGEMRNLLTRALARASTFKTRKPAPSLIARLKSAPKLAERPKQMAKPAIAVAEAPGAQSVKPFAAATAAPLTKPAAPAPKIASVPATATLPNASLAAAVEQPKALAPPPAMEPQPPAEQPAAVAVAAAQPAPVDVFKVKRVMVAPRQGPKAPPVSADQTTDMPDDDSAAQTPAENLSISQLAAATTIAGTAEDTGPTTSTTLETVIAKTTVAADATAVRLPSVLDNKVAMLGARDVAPPVESQPQPAIMPEAKPAAPRPVAKASVAPQLTPVERGRAPSSFQAQASQLAGPPQRVASLQPTTTGSTAVSSRYEIQIGAYSSIDEAQRALTATQARAGKLLSGSASVTHPVQKAGRQVFRARFTGFDSNRASQTCTELRRQAIDCFVMIAE